MRVSISAKLLGLLAALSLAAVGVHAQTVASALANFDASVRAYNIVALGASATTTISTSQDVEGGLAIRGNLTINGDNLMSQNSAYSTGTDPAVYVAGKLTVNGSAKLEYGTMSLGSTNSSYFTYNSSTKDLVENSGSGDVSMANSPSSQNPLTGSAPSNWNWATIQSNLIADQNTLAHATSNGTTVINGTVSVSGQSLVLTPNSTPANDATVIFTIDASLMGNGTYNGQQLSSISINVPADVNYVINVINAGSGTTSLFQGVNFNSGTNDNQLLWNIEGSGTVNIDSNQFYGSILAPSATISNDGTSLINGQIVANSVTYSGGHELHDESFTSFAVVAVPEPRTFALWGVALCGAAIVVRRKLVHSDRVPATSPVTR